MQKVVLITGGSSGIGKAVGEYLQQKNHIVYGTSRLPQRCPDSAFPLLELDVTQPQTIAKAVATVLKNEGRLDVLINNAGVGIAGPMEETPTEEIRNAFETNFYGPLHVIKAVLPKMREQQCGMIINITSIAGYMGLPYRGVYSATKAALAIATEAYRTELKQFNIQMTNVAPGDFATNIAAGRYHAPLLERSPYRKDYGGMLKTMNGHVKSGKDPAQMAEKIFDIINTANPPVNHKVGAFMQKFSIVLKRVLPSKTYERILMRHYKLK